MSRFPNTIDPIAKLKIICLEVTGRPSVVAQFNPKEIGVDTSVPWTKQPTARGVTKLEYTGGEQRTMSFELLFDGFETGESVLPQIDNLYGMIKHIGTDRDDKRPPKVKVVWGTGEDSTDLRAFVGVLESIAVKYTMFSPSGVVVRATANVKFKDAEGTVLGIGTSK